MRRRDLGAVGALGIVVTVVVGLSMTDFHGRSMTSRSSPFASSSPGFIEVILGWILVALGGLVALGIVVLLVHQYVRWEDYRPAIHLALLLLAFVVGLAIVLGPVGVGSAVESMSVEEAKVIRVAGAGLLFFLVLFVARLFHETEGENGEGH